MDSRGFSLEKMKLTAKDTQTVKDLCQQVINLSESLRREVKVKAQKDLQELKVGKLTSKDSVRRPRSTIFTLKPLIGFLSHNPIISRLFHLTQNEKTNWCIFQWRQSCL